MPILKYSSIRSDCIAAAFTVGISGTVIALVFLILFLFLGGFDTFDSCWVECCVPSWACILRLYRGFGDTMLGKRRLLKQESYYPMLATHGEEL
jgi:hypothetical protein